MLTRISQSRKFYFVVLKGRSADKPCGESGQPDRPFII